MNLVAGLICDITVIFGPYSGRSLVPCPNIWESKECNLRSKVKTISAKLHLEMNCLDDSERSERLELESKKGSQRSQKMIKEHPFDYFVICDHFSDLKS